MRRNGHFAHPFADGDVWVNLGCWWHGRLPEAMAAIRAAGVDVHSHVLIHDCVPLLFPEFCPRDMTADWNDAAPALVAGTRTFLTYSENTGRDVLEALLPESAGVKTDIRRIRLGDAFQPEAWDARAASAIRAKLGLVGDYIPIVGTIEARKGHALALRAWRTMHRRRIREQLPPLPRLVFVGKWGWKTTDLQEQIRDSEHLDGDLMVLENLPDAALDAVYRGALFTLFPSLYEGWGLPVRESHAYGKICVAAANSSITEAGGDLAIYFENDCQGSLVAAVEALLADPAAREAREARIRAEFTPVGWDESWRDLVAAVRSHKAVG
jgi:glycosyltransferase involved in cell wall biosynthesis